MFFCLSCGFVFSLGWLERVCRADVMQEIVCYCCLSIYVAACCLLSHAWVSFAGYLLRGRCDVGGSEWLRIFDLGCFLSFL